jgi:hypothetical protein
MKAKSKLPLRITLLLCLVLIITAWNLVRLLTSIGWRDTLETYDSYPGPIYIGLTGALWTLAGLFILWSFIKSAYWTRNAILISSFVYVIWFWMDRIFVQSQLRANWPFDLLATIILLGFISAVVLDPHNQIYFLKRDL